MAPDRDALRCEVQRFADGWGWHGWAERTNDSWQALRAPQDEHRRRRFRTREQAEEFFRLLAEFMSDVPDRTEPGGTDHPCRVVDG